MRRQGAAFAVGVPGASWGVGLCRLVRSSRFGQEREARRQRGGCKPRAEPLEPLAPRQAPHARPRDTEAGQGAGCRVSGSKTHAPRALDYGAPACFSGASTPVR